MKALISSDNNAPDYYVSGRKYEPIQIIDEWGLSFELGNTVKYISRAGRKEGTTEKELDDIDKAMVYLQFEKRRQKRATIPEQVLTLLKTQRMRKQAPNPYEISYDWGLSTFPSAALIAIYLASDYKQPRDIRLSSIDDAYRYLNEHCTCII